MLTHADSVSYVSRLGLLVAAYMECWTDATSVKWKAKTRGGRKAKKHDGKGKLLNR